MLTHSPSNSTVRCKLLENFFVLGVVVLLPMAIAWWVMHLQHWDLSVPLVYLKKNGDETWQLVMTKMLVDTGWILNNPFLGAPDVAHWHNNSAGQASALHSVIMLVLSALVHNPVRVQQVYFLLNFGLISLTSYWACRLVGLARLPAWCIGLLFSLQGYRFNFIIYSFLANYFTVPLALVAVFWVITGRFFEFFVDPAKSNQVALKEVFRSRKFYLGLFFCVLIALSDGYYAFFTLLLLGYALAIRVLSGDLKKAASLLVPVIYMAALVVVVLALTYPIEVYKHSHASEFAPGGIPDPALEKHPYEAEVYASSLKLLIMPPPNHRVKLLALIGKKILGTSEGARQFKFGAHGIFLGFLGSGLFAGALILLCVPSLRRVVIYHASVHESLPEETLLGAVLATALFIFLCAISGGIGTLIALVYPTIRAYDRFPLFLVFVLFVGAGAVVTAALKQTVGRRYWLVVGLTVLITLLALFDEIPKGIAKNRDELRERFLAERHFVGTIENALPTGAMVYQYPYSQYLTDNDYYGWGSFAHVRLYLHSAALRWSNGASKNSPIDRWHTRLSHLPLEQWLTEVQAAGFSAVVVDRLVVSPEEYARIRPALLKRSDGEIIDDPASHQAFFRLKDPGYRLVYDAAHQDVVTLLIHDRAKVADASLPRLVNAQALKHFLSTYSGTGELVIERAAHPELFYASADLDRGDGDTHIMPLTDMRGQLQCAFVPAASGSAGPVVQITIKNDSNFDWEMNQGSAPIRVGAHFLHPNGTMQLWDNSWRLATDTPGLVTGNVTHSGFMPIPRGTAKQFQFPLTEMKLQEVPGGGQNIVIDFHILQEGYAWFEHFDCKLPVTN